MASVIVLDGQGFRVILSYMASWKLAKGYTRRCLKKRKILEKVKNIEELILSCYRNHSREDLMSVSTLKKVLIRFRNYTGLLRIGP